jgi:[ribosomal protein S18]-alanine N-acetyltransferase
MEIKVFDSYQPLSMMERKQTIDFLHTHLDEFTDDKESIGKAIEYALGETSVVGGFILLGYLEDDIAGAVIVNRTGMDGYIPANILVYIAVNRKYRGKGHGKTLMQKTLDLAKGSVKLHVEPNNPARFLYEKFGFTTKYLEYRLMR